MEQYLLNSSRPSIIWVESSLISDRIDSKYFDYKFLNNVDNIKKIDTVKLKNLCIVSRGNTPKPNQYEEGTKYFIIKSDNLTSKGLAYENIPTVSQEYFQENKIRKLKNESILISSIGSGSTGKADILSKEGNYLSVAENTIFEISTNKIDMFYLVSFLRSKYGNLQLLRNEKGSSGQTHLYPKDLAEIEIPVTEYKIQKYIGDKVRRAEELREEAKKIEGFLDNEFDSLFNITIETTNAWYISPEKLEDRIDSEYNYNYFYELEDKFRNRGFKTYKFGELIKTKMSEPQTDSSDFISEGIPLLRISDIYEDYIDFDNCAKISEEVYDELKDFQLIPKDIIFGLSGTVGRAIVVPEEIPSKAITNRRVAKITLYQPALSHYVAMFLNSKFGKFQLIRETAGGVQKNLRLEDISKVLIPIPDSEVINRTTDLMEKKISYLSKSKELIQQAKQDVEDLIEGNFDMTKLNEASTESR